MVKRIVSIVISVIVLGGLGYMVYQNVQKGIEKKKQDLEKQRNLSSMDRRLIVGVTPARRSSIDRAITASGTLVAKTQATVFSLVPGIIESFKVKEGDVVKSGDILARLESWKMALGYRQARAGLSQARINLESMSTNYTRMKHLYEEKAIPKADFEKVELGLRAARQQVNMANAAASMASSTWSDATIKAPIDGTVIMKAVEKGDLMTSAQAMKTSPLLVIAQLDTMKVDIYVSEKHILYLKKGLKAKIHVDAYKTTFYGEIDQIGEILDPVTKTLKVSIKVPNTEFKAKVSGSERIIKNPLKVGMFARVALILEERKGHITLPLDVVIRRDGYDFLFIYKDGKVTQRLIKAGIVSESQMEVIDGLKEGEKVVVLGQRALYDGQPVRLMEEDPFKFHSTFGKVPK
ncbi:efflux RND transporter periplasmic adaptor subunit [Myxococcota bacterium]|nr:efflux RND transporter periplasmic adaptor subunit [Myxococcota bacterium]